MIWYEPHLSQGRKGRAEWSQGRIRGETQQKVQCQPDQALRRHPVGHGARPHPPAR